MEMQASIASSTEKRSSTRAAIETQAAEPAPWRSRQVQQLPWRHRGAGKRNNCHGDAGKYSDSHGDASKHSNSHEDAGKYSKLHRGAGKYKNCRGDPGKHDREGGLHTPFLGAVWPCLRPQWRQERGSPRACRGAPAAGYARWGLVCLSQMQAQHGFLGRLAGVCQQTVVLVEVWCVQARSKCSVGQAGSRPSGTCCSMKHRQPSIFKCCIHKQKQTWKSLERMAKELPVLHEVGNLLPRGCC
eukprot:71233-Pelagomonas_calceolata.AAC.6